MSRDFKPHKRLWPDWDRRVWGGVLLTAVWILGGVVYIASAGGWGFFSQDADTIGGFLEGFFAPVAFLWLVLGLFVQQEEIARNRDEMERSNLLSEQQARAMEEAALTARQQAFFLIADNVRRQTGNLLGAMLASEGRPNEEMERQWMAHAAGDYELFPRLLVERYDMLRDERFGVVNGGESLFFGTPNRKGLTEEYIRSFRRLLRQARECDQDFSILATVLQAPHGVVYSGMLQHMPAESAWVTLLQDAGSASGPDADVVGRWDIDEEGETATHPAAASIITLARHGSRLTATAQSQISSPEAETVAVRGRALFLRFLVPLPILITAVVNGDRMHGQTETGQGDIFRFAATRSNQEQ